MTYLLLLLPEPPPPRAPKSGAKTSPKNAARRRRRRARFLDVTCVLLVGFALLQGWINGQIPMGDGQTSTIFPGCYANVVDIHYGWGRGSVVCGGSQWWAGLLPDIANGFGANDPFRFFPYGGDSGSFLVGLLVGLIVIGWLSYRTVRLFWRFVMRQIRNPGD